MNLIKDLGKLCEPAKFYFILSSLSILGLALQNIFAGKKGRYCARYVFM